MTLLLSEVQALAPGHSARISPVPPSFLACLAVEWTSFYRKPLVVVCEDTPSALSLIRDVQVFAPSTISAIAVPMKGDPSGRAPGGIHILRSSDTCVLATTPEALATSFQFAAPGVLTTGQQFATRQEFLALLSKWGYQRGEEPLHDGEFTVRGETTTIRIFGGLKYRLRLDANTLAEIIPQVPSDRPTLLRLEVPRALAELSSAFLMDLIPMDVEIWSNDSVSLLTLYAENAARSGTESHERLCASPDALRRWLEERVHKVFLDFPAESCMNLGAEPASFRLSRAEALEDFLKRLPDGCRSIYAFVSENFPLRAHLADRGIIVRKGPLSEGWVARNSGVIALTDLNLLPHETGEPFERRLSLSHFKPGDLVVHEDHGIAVYRGLEHQRSADVERDFLVLEYEAGDRLYLPVEHAYKVHRYIGITGHIPVLSRLGGRQWKRTLRKVREATANEARELYNLYRTRLSASGRRHESDTDWQKMLEDAFPFEETPDQRLATLEVKRDMESPRVMDRLIIGDVGFGKTEIAVRAAFKAVMSGTQVAVLAPTTVLTYQHYQVFRNRMANFPVEIALMSRFRTPAENSAVAESLALGKIDIVIGTHRLLAKDVTFKRLGLLIIDEEQRLGVYHKEKLKLRYPDVDVLTLSATPIPRTLYQTLIQVKSISYVRTPPEGRFPVITRVGMYASDAVRSAMASELARNGQVLYLYNRIQGLKERADRIQEWFPHIRVSVAHGRMKSRDLEKTIREFISGECRVLVSTTLIENGVDIPGADTLIVEEAERYGLAELHQLRGRVGRGPRQAYAYFFTDPRNPLPPGARERLKAISRYSYLGAGFELSYRDLELRGAGELLGRRQHGFAAQVGLIMYARALGSALAPLLGKKIPHRPQIEIPASAYLPSDYVPLEEERARIYEEILQAEEVGNLERVARDLESVYGRLPLPVRTLLDIAYIRKLAELCNLDRLELDPSGKIARFEGDVHSDLLLPFPQIREVKTDPHSGSTRFVAIIKNKENALDELRALLEHLVQDAALRSSEKVI